MVSDLYREKIESAHRKRKGWGKISFLGEFIIYSPSNCYKPVWIYFFC